MRTTTPTHRTSWTARLKRVLIEHERERLRAADGERTAKDAKDAKADAPAKAP